MELATTLKTQTVRAGVREVGINANYWYPVGWASNLKSGEVISVKVWNQEIAVYRDGEGQIHALEDLCPHKGVALHKGKVMGRNLACRYHGWEFDGQGDCVHIPYLPPEQKLPCAKAKAYPVQEKYDLIWVFPGDSELAGEQPPPDVPEYGQPGWFDVSVTARFDAHFSICNENSMDVFHGFLHENLQGWYNPVLQKLRETEDTVTADYRVSYRGKLAKFLGLSDTTEEVTRTVSVQYRYPHYYSTMPGVSALYLMRLPVAATESRSFALFFFRVPLPNWVLEPIKPVLRAVLRRFVLHRFLDQDIEMMESEQQHYLQDPRRRLVEINPAIVAVQRLIVRQSERYQASLAQTLQNGHNGRDPIVRTATPVSQEQETPHLIG